MTQRGSIIFFLSFYKLFLTRKFITFSLIKQEKVEDGEDARNIPTHVHVLRRETARVGNVPDAQMLSDVVTQSTKDVKRIRTVVQENVLEINAPIVIA